MVFENHHLCRKHPRVLTIHAAQATGRHAGIECLEEGGLKLKANESRYEALQENHLKLVYNFKKKRSLATKGEL